MKGKGGGGKGGGRSEAVGRAEGGEREGTFWQASTAMERFECCRRWRGKETFPTFRRGKERGKGTILLGDRRTSLHRGEKKGGGDGSLGSKGKRRGEKT